MPTKEKKYDRVVFTPEAIKDAVNTLVATSPHNGRGLRLETLEIELPSGEAWHYDNEDEFFADYRKGFTYAQFRKLYQNADIIIHIYLRSYGQYTKVIIKMPNRADVEKVFNVFESKVEECRLPKQPKEKSKAKTDWIAETVAKVESRCHIAGRKLELALIKLESEEAEEWQSAAMHIRDAWIELTQWLCQVNNIDTSDIPSDAVVERLRKLKIDETDERSFNLARASFNLSMKHHARKIDNDTATACVISTIVSMQTVIREVFSATR